jgi:precorrin-6A/cobalt-precorrin-6A reductase
MQLLILGGTTEASALARRLAGRSDIHAILSFAGRTSNPATPPIPFRSGGFGGAAGLAAWLRDQRIEAVIDATHPFAQQISANAAAACGELGLPLAILGRPGWTQGDGDRWIRVADMAAAVRALGEAPRRVFLTIGGLQLAQFARAPQHYYVVRTIERPQSIDMPASHRLILARGPFDVAGEVALMRDEGIEILVTKNSGAAATGAKLEAARQLGVGVVMIDRPAAGRVPMLHDIDQAMAWIDGHNSAP